MRSQHGWRFLEPLTLRSILVQSVFHFVGTSYASGSNHEIVEIADYNQSKPIKTQFWRIPSIVDCGCSRNRLLESRLAMG